MNVQNQEGKHLIEVIVLFSYSSISTISILDNARFDLLPAVSSFKDYAPLREISDECQNCSSKMRL